MKVRSVVVHHIMRAILAGAAGLLLTNVGCAGPPAGEPPPAAAPGSFPAGTFVDLSYAYDASTLFWPTAEPFRLRTVFHGKTPQGFFYAANDFTASEHGGTHIDAPLHFAEGRRSVDEIPLEQLIGIGVLVDVSKQAAGNPDYQVTAADFQQWESRHGQIPAGALVLLRTGYGRHWPDAVKYLGTADRGQAATAKLHFPGLHPDAARWLTTSRSIHGVGLDTASIDYGQSTLFETHRVLMEQNVPAFENLANLDRLPETGFSLIALPIKIGGGSGGPLRAVAVLP
jgi:kynurenine formamidase